MMHTQSTATARVQAAINGFYLPASPRPPAYAGRPDRPGEEAAHNIAERFRAGIFTETLSQRSQLQVVGRAAYA